MNVRGTALRKTKESVLSRVSENSLADLAAYIKSPGILEVFEGAQEGHVTAFSTERKGPNGEPKIWIWNDRKGTMKMRGNLGEVGNLAEKPGDCERQHCQGNVAILQFWHERGGLVEGRINGRTHYATACGNDLNSDRTMPMGRSTASKEMTRRGMATKNTKSHKKRRSTANRAADESLSGRWKNEQTVTRIMQLLVATISIRTVRCQCDSRSGRKR
jgi:hypothetical protein